MKLYVHGGKEMRINPITVIRILESLTHIYIIEELVIKDLNYIDLVVGYYAEIRRIPLFRPLYNKINSDRGLLDLLVELEAVNRCDGGILIWDGKSEDCLRVAKNLIKAGKLLEIFHIGETKPFKCPKCGGDPTIMKNFTNGEHECICVLCHYKLKTLKYKSLQGEYPNY